MRPSDEPMTGPNLNIAAISAGAGSIALAAIFVLSSLRAGSADTLRDQCLGTASQPLKIHLTQGHYRLVLLEAPKIEAGANSCITAGYDVNSFHLVHSYALIMEAQARAATGDAQGVVFMRRGVEEATALSNAPGVQKDIRVMARDAAYGGELELKAMKSAKPGQLITPPPPAPK
jgi:hypothetical protein